MCKTGFYCATFEIAKYTPTQAGVRNINSFFLKAKSRSTLKYFHCE
jgi:hypothetical protein